MLRTTAETIQSVAKTTNARSLFVLCSVSMVNGCTGVREEHTPTREEHTPPPLCSSSTEAFASYSPAV
jgi:hypothetical protein